MIAKRIDNPRKSASKSTRIKKLINYICNPGTENVLEKCIYSNGRGFICSELRSRQAEMIALATECVKSTDPIKHYVFSLKDGERATAEQIELWVDIFLKEVGLVDHQVIYALHDDTGNMHLHVAINLVNPVTSRVVKPNNGFDLEALHRAVARIEFAQGWQREPNGRYCVQANGRLSQRPAVVPDKTLAPDQTKQGMEHRTGAKSAERIAIEVAGPILRRVDSWGELHEQLAQHAMRYVKKGSGASVFVHDVEIKASACDRGGSFSKMEKRLGPWQPSTLSAVGYETKPVPEPIHDLPGWRIYINSRGEHYQMKRVDTTSLQTRQSAERIALVEFQRTQRAEVFNRNWRGRGVLRNALASILASQQLVAKLVLKDQHARERNALRFKYRPWPDFEQWLQYQKQPELAWKWRYRLNPDGEPARIYGISNSSVIAHDIRAFVPDIKGSQVFYTHQDTGRLGFIDKGLCIEIQPGQQTDALLAALQLASQKWGSFQVTGNEQYKFMCVMLAVRHGFKIDNPELQMAIISHRQLMREDRQFSPVIHLEKCIEKLL